MEASIMWLDLRKAVQKRPGLYFGDMRTISALHMAVEYLLEGSIEVAGARKATIYLHPDGIIGLADDAPHFRNDLSSWAVFGEYSLLLLIAASSWLVARTETGEIAFVEGLPVNTHSINLPFWEEPSSKIMFCPDPMIFGELRRTSALRLLAWSEGMAISNPGASITVIDATGIVRQVCYPFGIADRLDELDAERTIAHDRPLLCTSSDGADSCEIALRFNYTGPHRVETFVNARRTIGDGPHVDGLLDALAEHFGKRIPAVTAVFNLRIHEPVWGSSVKERLDNPAAYQLAKRAAETLPKQIEDTKVTFTNVGPAEMYHGFGMTTKAKNSMP